MRVGFHWPKIITARARKPKPATPFSNFHSLTPAVMYTMTAQTAQQTGDQHAGIAHLVDVDTHGVRRLRMLAAGHEAAGRTGSCTAAHRRSPAAMTAMQHEPVELKAADVHKKRLFDIDVAEWRTTRWQTSSAVLMALTMTRSPLRCPAGSWPYPPASDPP